MGLGMFHSTMRGNLGVKAGKIDITLVAGRRPELLERTLSSFAKHVFPNFHISQVFANIDPFMGTITDGEACRQIILENFPDAEISIPEKPGFGLAVKTLWGKITSPLALHLEDDWLVLEKVSPEQVFPQFEGRVRMATMVTPENVKARRYRRNRFRTTRKKIPFTPLKYKAPLFTLCPCFIERDFAHEYARLLNPELDPEAQNYKDSGRYNPELSRYCDRFQNIFLKGKEDPALIIDIGRAYQAERGIIKTEDGGESLWIRRGRN